MIDDGKEQSLLSPDMQTVIPFMPARLYYKDGSIKACRYTNRKSRTGTPCFRPCFLIFSGSSLTAEDEPLSCLADAIGFLKRRFPTAAMPAL